MQKTLLVVSLLFFLLFAGKAYPQNTSNKGKEFWLGYGNHVAGFDRMSQQMALYITSDVNTSVKVEVPGIGYSQTYQVSANSITVASIPQEAYLSGQGKSDKGIHVVAQRPVVVYSHIYDQAVSGATLVLPVNTLGREYYSINYSQVSNSRESYSYFFVVAVEDDTEVEIVPSANTQGDADGPWPGGIKRIIKLNKGEIYQVLGEGGHQTQIGIDTRGEAVYDYTGVDLSGSTIKSVSTGNGTCKKIAVFSGSGKIAIGCNSGTRSSDNLYQQVYPTAAWGKNFITTPLKDRNYDIIRIVKSNANAEVKLNGAVIPASSFINNFYYEFPTIGPHFIQSDLPIQVVQYAVTQNQARNCQRNSEFYGDPEMIFLNPVEQNIEKITVYSSPYFNIQTHYLNVVMETSAIGSFRLDGTLYASSFRPVPANPLFSYAQISVSQGVHTLSADRGFNAIAYGFGQAESYGYSAGTNVKSLGVELVSKVTNRTETVGCINEPFDFKVNLLYPTNKIVWDIGDGSVPLTVNNPQFISSELKDGKLYYVYQYPNSPIVFSNSGDYSIMATADKPLADGCGSTEDFAVDFSIFDPPTADFSFPDTVCAGTAVTFTDKSDGKGAAIKSWAWHFDDPHATPANPNSSSSQNPSHIFNRAGIFKIKLSVNSATTCDAQFVEHTLVVLENPIADFTFPADVCEGLPITFTDKSTLASAGGLIKKWRWRFNDGNATPQNPDTSSKQDPSHIFGKSGVYNVELRVESSFGCVASISLPVKVGVPPVPDFALPKICLDDAFAEFEASVNAADVTGITYMWDFGDDRAGAANPNTATGPHVRHKYTEAKEYTVTLTAISGSGCSTPVQKQFVVNGSTPVAAFKILTPPICAGKEIVVEDNATVDFGQITKIEWYLDLNSETPDFTDEAPNLRSQPAKQYTLRIPVFYSPAVQIVPVKMRVYSGNSCADEAILNFQVKAIPQLDFDSIPPLCAEADPIKLVQAREIHGVISGTETYSGKGVTKNGFFYPGRAGAGTHTITYTFTASNGCSATESRRVTVYPSPLVDAGKEISILEGEELQLNARVSGRGLALKWVCSNPLITLSKDDIPNPTSYPTENSTYTLTAVSADGCTSSSSVLVRVLKDLKVSNAITPNGDGKNDRWEIEYLKDYPGCRVDIYNRFGARVFSSVGYGEPWDGRYNGSNLPEGTYYYVINPKNGRKLITGNVTIIR